MKGQLLIALSLITLSTSLFAKTVKFSVDMRRETVSPNGVHIMGNFQKAAGYKDDFCPDCTKMIQEGSTTIYSVTVNIPAFKEYEYIFVNGDLSYETEFVPIENRIGYDFNDNRWVYVDSLDNGTMDIGAIIYKGIAPANKALLRLLVDMTKETVSAKGVHVAGSFQSWNTTSNILYHFDTAPAGIYEAIVFVDKGSYEYKFYNGNATGNTESVPGGCTTSGNRTLKVDSVMVLDAVCFSGCTACVTGIIENANAANIKLYPNPTQNLSTLTFINSTGLKTIIIRDMLGKVLLTTSVSANTYTIQKDNLKPGLYFVQVIHSSRAVSTGKLIIE